MLKQDTNRLLLDSQGFTLIDVAIFMIIIGLIAAPLIHVQNSRAISARIDNTRGTLNDIDSAIAAYFFDNGHYPCPADITLPRDDPNYGIAQDCSGAGNFATGGVPFINLRIPATRTIDAWHNRISYTVTTTQTDESTYGNNGVLVVHRFEDGIFNTAVTNVHYALISHGPDGNGAYATEGNLVAPCPSGAMIPRDAENCNGNDIFILDNGAQSQVRGENYFDDITHFRFNGHTRLWNINANPDDISSLNLNIGISNENPRTALHVLGNVRAENDPSDVNKRGNLGATLFCNEEGNNCFATEIIAGSGIACSNNTGMSGIARADTRCNVTFISGTPSACPAGEYATGIDATGELICN